MKNNDAEESKQEQKKGNELNIFDKNSNLSKIFQLQLGKKVEQTVTNQIKKVELYDIVKIAITMYVNKFWIVNIKVIYIKILIILCFYSQFKIKVSQKQTNKYIN